MCEKIEEGKDLLRWLGKLKNIKGKCLDLLILINIEKWGNWEKLGREKVIKLKMI